MAISHSDRLIEEELLTLLLSGFCMYSLSTILVLSKTCSCINCYCLLLYVQGKQLWSCGDGQLNIPHLDLLSD